MYPFPSTIEYGHISISINIDVLKTVVLSSLYVSIIILKILFDFFSFKDKFSMPESGIFRGLFIICYQ